MRLGDPADGGGRVDQAAISGDMGHGDKADIVVDHGGEGVGVQGTTIVVWNHVYGDAKFFGDLKIGNIVGAVFRDRRQNSVALAPIEGVKSHVPGPGCIFDKRNFAGLAVQ